MGLVSMEKGHPRVLFLLGSVAPCVGRRRNERSPWRPIFQMAAQKHKNSDPFTMQRLLMKFSWVVTTPIAHVLLIHATGNVEMGLVAKDHERVRRYVFQERFTNCLASVKITFSELLHYCHFV